MEEDANDLLLFAEVARAQSLAEVARRLRVPKSTLGRRLANLEERVGTRLINRTTRRMRLTEVGEAYLGFCERLVHDMEEARAFAESVSQRPAGVLRLTMPQGFCTYYLRDALASFIEAHPTLRVEIDFTVRHVDLVGERFDLAIRAGKLVSSSLIVRKLATTACGLYASPQYLRSHPEPLVPEDLASHRFVLRFSTPDGTNVIRLSRGADMRQTAVAGPIVSNSFEANAAMAAAAQGILMSPVRICAAAVAAGELVRVLPDWSPDPMEAYYVIPSRQLLPAKTRLFIDHITAYFAGSHDNPI